MLFDGMAWCWWRWCRFQVLLSILQMTWSSLTFQSAVLILFGGLLLVLAGIMEFIIGNTFPSIVFSHLGAFCLAFGATLTPAFNAAGKSHSDPNLFSHTNSSFY